MSRDFKGIWIPREIWLSKELSMQEKVFLAEIHSLDNEQGCIASNAYFAEFFQLSKSSVSRVISNLSSKGLCTVTLIYKDNKEVDKRVIRCEKYGNKEVKVVASKEPRTSAVKDLYITDKQTSEFVDDVVLYLNDKTEKSFRNTNASAKFIVARLREDYSLEDFKQVIDVKCSQWLNTDFDKFLRPSTLFNATKFQEYLAEKPAVEKTAVNERITNSQKGFYDV